MDLVLSPINIGGHLWIPPTGAVTKMHSGLDKLLYSLLIYHDFSVGSAQFNDTMSVSKLANLEAGTPDCTKNVKEKAANR